MAGWTNATLKGTFMRDPASPINIAWWALFQCWQRSVVWHILCLHQICGCINYYCGSSWQINYTGFLLVLRVIALPISHCLSTKCSKSWISYIHFMNQSPWTSLQQFSQQEIVQPKLYFYNKKKSLINHYIYWARNKGREE